MINKSFFLSSLNIIIGSLIPPTAEYSPPFCAMLHKKISFAFRCELFAERSRRSHVEQELSAARSSNALLLAEAAAARAGEAQLRARREEGRRQDRDFAGQLDAAADRAESSLSDAAVTHYNSHNRKAQSKLHVALSWCSMFILAFRNCKGLGIVWWDSPNKKRQSSREEGGHRGSVPSPPIVHMK